MKPQFEPVAHMDIVWIGGDRFCNHEPLSFTRPNGQMIVVPLLERGPVRLGFVHDGGSIPLIAVPIVGDRTSRAFLAFIVHDFLYVHKTVSRALADRILLEGMEALGVNRIRRRLIWGAVRAAGWAVWRAAPPLNTATISALKPGPHWRVLRSDEPRHRRIREVKPSVIDRALAALTLRGVET